MSSSESNAADKSSDTAEPRTSADSKDEKPRANLKRPRGGEEEDANGEADNIYSLEEIIEADKMDEEMVSAVLGASDVVNCSYEQGYVYRRTKTNSCVVFTSCGHLFSSCFVWCF